MTFDDINQFSKWCFSKGRFTWF